MSNKTQLQTNNTNLDALITRVNAAKDTVASLPNAGSSGGGGVSSATITISTANGPVLTTPLIYYTTDTMEIVNNAPVSSGMTITVAVGTILVTSGGSSMDSATGDIYSFSYSNGLRCYQVYGHGSIHIRPM